MKKNLLLFCYFIIISCNQKIKSEKEIIDPLPIDSFSYNLKNKEKLFLKFWSNMTVADYNKTCNLLIADSILEYNSNHGNCYVFDRNIISPIKPFKFSTNNLGFITFNQKNENNLKDSDIIDGIELASITPEAYEYFRKKYNLPQLIKKINAIIYIEENPLINALNVKEIQQEKASFEKYQNQKKNENQQNIESLQNKEDLQGKVIKSLNSNEIFNIFNDKSNHEWKNVEYADIYFYTVKEEIIKKNKNAVIIIKEKTGHRSSGISTHINADYYYKNLEKSSKERIVVEKEYSSVSIFYLSHESYEKLIQNKRSKLQKQLDDSLKEKTRYTKRNINVKDEI